MGKIAWIGAVLLFSFQTKTFEGVVTNVQDGDTLEVTIDGKVVVVRLHGIDCPEDGQAFSAKAKQYTMLHALTKKVKLEKVTTDVYGRMIAYVYLEDGTNLNNALVAAGYAWHYKQYSDDKTLDALEKEARKKKVGLWLETKPVPPWEYKEQKRKKEN
jgi:micrococcal nuclease